MSIPRSSVELATPAPAGTRFLLELSFGEPAAVGATDDTRKLELAEILLPNLRSGDCPLAISPRN